MNYERFLIDVHELRFAIQVKDSDKARARCRDIENHALIDDVDLLRRAAKGLEECLRMADQDAGHTCAAQLSRLLAEVDSVLQPINRPRRR